MYLEKKTIYYLHVTLRFELKNAKKINNFVLKNSIPFVF